MPAERLGTKAATKPARGFTEEERAAMRARARESRQRARAEKEDPEGAVQAAIAAMQPSSRAIAERLHSIVKAYAPSLTPRTWYGMPAYAKGDDVVCFFRPAEKFKTRYSTLGFSDEAKLDDGRMWPTDFALTSLTATEEARIIALVKKAVS